MWGGSVADIPGLKAIDTTGLQNGIGLAVQSKLDWYLFNSSSSATTDDDAVVAPTTGPGRWFRKSSGREVLTSDRTYYVSTTGDDSNDGLTSGTPFLTIPKAIAAVASLDLKIYNPNIQLADGTYTITSEISLKQLTGAGTVTIQGNPTTPSNVVINQTTADQACFVSRKVKDYRLKNLKLTNSANF